MFVSPRANGVAGDHGEVALAKAKRKGIQASAEPDHWSEPAWTKQVVRTSSIDGSRSSSQGVVLEEGFQNPQACSCTKIRTNI